jgi:hypothetical protein
MFTLLPSTQNLLLTALLILWAVLLFGGFIFGKRNAERTRRMPTWTRLASSFVLVAAAWSWALLIDHPEQFIPLQSEIVDCCYSTIYHFSKEFALLIAIGMTLGFIGDFFMSRKILSGGLASFGLGHIFYIAAFIKFGDDIGSNNLQIRLTAWLVWLIIGVIAWYIIVFRGQKMTPIHWAALPYTLLLASTAGFATSLALQQPYFIPLAIGAALFLFSDLLISLQLFLHKTFYLIDDVVWLTYGPAQMLIIYSIYAALLVVS